MIPRKCHLGMATGVPGQAIVEALHGAGFCGRTLASCLRPIVSLFQPLVTIDMRTAGPAAVTGVVYPIEASVSGDVANLQGVSRQGV